MLYRCDPTLKKPQALCLAPTRELARQILAVVSAMGKFVNIKTFLGCPGVDVPPGQKIDAPLIVGTPGRVESLIKKKLLDTTHLQIFVLDEADMMVSEGGMRDRSMSIKKYVSRGSHLGHVNI